MKIAAPIIILLLFFAIPTHAQTREVDSLRGVVHRASSPAGRLQAILRLCELYQTVHRDTLYNYALEATELSHRLKDERAMSLAAFALANAYLRWGWVDSVLHITDPQLALNPVTSADRRPIYFGLMRQKAMAYGGRSDYKTALSLLYTIVSEAETYRDSLVLAVNLNTIGSIAVARDQPDEAIRFFNTALSYCSLGAKFYGARAAIYTNMAGAYFQADRIDSADLLIGQAVPLCRRAGNLNTLATALRIQSNIDIRKNKLAAAEAALKEMFQIRRSVGDADAIVDDNLLMIDFYLKTGQAQRGIDYCKARLARGDIYDKRGGVSLTNNINLRLLYFQALAKCYKATNNMNAYQETLENIIMAKDSFYQANSAQAIAELQTKYDVEKMRSTVATQKLDLTRKNYLFYGSLVLVFLLAVIGWLIFRNYRRKQAIRMQLLQEEEKRLSREAVKEAEETERKRIAADLHDSLGAYAASILSNIDHIKLSAGSGNAVALEALRDNSQTIVSQLSDTIWALKKEALSLTAISDRLKVFMRRVGISYPDAALDVAEEIEEDKAFTPSQAFHLFNMAKEAITNALRHSGGNHVTVTVRGGSEWSISIEDNGNGMTGRQNLSESGNGLFNMSMRAREGGWNIQWKARAGGGTEVLIGSAAEL